MHTYSIKTVESHKKEQALVINCWKATVVSNLSGLLSGTLQVFSGIQWTTQSDTQHHCNQDFSGRLSATLYSIKDKTLERIS